jgi:hypothetical protein
MARKVGVARLTLADHCEAMMPDPNYVSVRRPVDAPFGVIPGDLVADAPDGYDLSLVRELTTEGQVVPIEVRPVADGTFEVTDGRKRLAAIQLLVRTNKLVFDRIRGFARPARKAFALVLCRIGRRTPW